MTETFPPNTGNKTRISALTTPIQRYTGSPGQCNKEKRQGVYIQIEKKRNKTVLYLQMI